MNRRGLLRSLFLAIGAIPFVRRPVAAEPPVEQFYVAEDRKIHINQVITREGRCGACNPFDRARTPCRGAWNQQDMDVGTGIAGSSCADGIVTHRWRPEALVQGGYGGGYINEETAQDLAYMLNKARAERLRSSQL